MKNNLLYILLLIVIAFSACKKDGLAKYDIEKSFADPSVSLDDLKKQIAAGTDGFRMTIEPSTGKYYAGYISFDGTSTAKFLLDNSTANASAASDTKYSLSIRQTNPTLSLGSTSSFAVLAKNLGGIDSTYTYKSVKGDTLSFVGNLLGSKLYLIKSTKADATEYLAGKMTQSIASTASFKSFVQYFKRLTIGAKSYDFIINPTTKILTLNYLSGTAYKQFNTYYGTTNNGIVLKTAFSDGTNIITGLDGISVDLANDIATAKSGTVAATISGVAAPLYYDINAAKNWWTWAKASTYVSAELGFHINGVDDALGLRSLAGYKRIDYNPAASGAYDNARIAATTNYGPAIIPTFTTDGKVIFPNSGSQFGTVPAAAVAVYAKYLAQINQSQGYYLIQTNGGTTETITYDMVNVADAKAWVSWHY